MTTTIDLRNPEKTEIMETSKSFFELYDIVYSSATKCHAAIAGLCFKRLTEIWTVYVFDEYGGHDEFIENLKIVSSACKDHEEAIATIRAMNKLKNCKREESGTLGSTVSMSNFGGGGVLLSPKAIVHGGGGAFKWPWKK